MFSYKKHLLICIFLLSAFSGAAIAQTGNTVEASFSTFDFLESQSGLKLVLSSSETNFSQEAFTDEFGFATFSAVPAGEYVLRAEISESPNFVSQNTYCDTTSFSNFVFDDLSNFIDIQLKQAGGSVSINVQECETDCFSPTGAAVAGASVRAISFTNANKVLSATTDSLGQASIAFDSAECDDFGIEITATGFSKHRKKLNTFLSNTFEVTAGLQRTDAAINFSLIDSNGNAFTVPQSDPSSFLAPALICDDQNFETLKSFDVELFPGDQSISLSVSGGSSYSCSIFITDGTFSSSTTSVSAQTGAATDAVLDILERTADIEVRFVDASTQELISDLNNASVNINTTSLDIIDFGNAFPTGGVARLKAIPGVEYSVFTFIGGDLDPNTTDCPASGTTALVPLSDFVTVVPSASATTTISIPVVRTSSFLQLQALDTDGSALEFAFAEVLRSPVAGQERSNRRFFTQNITRNFSELNNQSAQYPIFNENGKALVPIVADRQHTVSLFPVFDDPFAPSPTAIGAKADVTLQNSECAARTLQLQPTNHVLNITANPINAGDSFELISCTAANASDLSVTELLLDGSSIDLNIIVNDSSDTWNVSCSLITNDSYFRGAATYKPAANSSSGSVTVNLGRVAAFFPKSSQTFDAAKAKTLKLADNRTTLEIPAKAIADSGNVTVTSGSGSGFSITSADFPLLDSAFDITFEVAGQKVSKTKKPVTIIYEITEAELAALGVDSKSLFVGSFDTKSRTWKEDARFIYDGQYLRGQLSHFSIWSALIDASKNPNFDPDSPSDRTIPFDLAESVLSKIKKKFKILLSWSNPAGVTDGTIYEVEVAPLKKARGKKNKDKKKKKKKKKKGKKKKKNKRRVLRAKVEPNWNKAKTFQVTGENSVEVTLPKGKHAFRVRIQGADNSEPHEFSISSRLPTS